MQLDSWLILQILEVSMSKESTKYLAHGKLHVKLQTGWRLKSCSRPVEIVSESLPLHTNHSDFDKSEAHDVATPCTNNASIVPASSTPTVAHNDYTISVSTALSPAVNTDAVTVATTPPLTEAPSPNQAAVPFLGPSLHSTHSHT